jgi:uncharacterized protein YjdB
LIVLLSTLMLSACSSGGGYSSNAVTTGSQSPAAALNKIEVTPADPSIAVSTSQQFTATGIYTDGSKKDITVLVNWSSSDTSIATLSNDPDSMGLATTLLPGTITVSAAFDQISGSTQLTVTPASLVSLAVSPPNPSIALGTTAQFTATGTFSDGTTQDLTASVIWGSSNNAIAALSSTGLATSFAAGAVTVGATLNGVSASTPLTVTPATLTSLEISPIRPSIALGTNLQFTATGIYTDGSSQDLTTDVTWSSSDSTAATISNAAGSKGLVISVAPGTVTVGAVMNGVSASTKLTVTAARLVSLAVSPTHPSIALGTTALFSAVGTFSDGSSQDLTANATWSSSDSAIAVLSNNAGSAGLATSVALGTVTVSAALNGVTGSTQLTVTPATLVSLAITPANPSIALGTTLQFILTGTYSDGSTQDLTANAVWSSSDNAIAALNNAAGSKGLASSVTPGTVTVTALFNGTSAFTQLTVTPATLASLEISPTRPSLALGTNLQFTATGIYTDGSSQDLTANVTWSSSDSAISTVSNAAGDKGLAISLSPGTVTVGITFNGVSASTQLTVTPATLVSLAITPTNPSIALGTTAQFTATGTYSDGTTQDLTGAVTWSSSDTGVATLGNAAGSAGLATSVATGTVTVGATLDGISTSTRLTVTPATLVSLAITPTNPSIALGTTLQFTATGTYTDASTQDLTNTATWSSSNPAVATLSNAAGGRGLAAGTAQGATTVGALVNGITASTQLTVTPATLVSLAITPTNPSIALGTNLRLAATGIYTDGSSQDLTTNVTWSSSDSTVATVSNAAGSKGVVISVAQGTITVGILLNGVSASTKLTVTPATLVSLAITPTNPSIALGTTLQFTATGTYTDGSKQDLTSTVTWSSSDSTVATLSNAAGSKGLATSVVQGTTTVGALVNGVSTSTQLAVTPATLVSLAISPSNVSIALGTTLQFTATGTYTDDSTQDLTTAVIWSSSDGTVATLSNAAGSQGLATGTKQGTVTVGAVLNGITASTRLTVTPATLVSLAITPNNPSIALGTSLQFNATGTYTDGSTQDLTTSVTWSPSTGTIATLSNAAGSKGLATSLAQGTVTVGAVLNGITASTQLTVTPATLVSLAITPTNPSIALGTSLQFSATGTYTDHSTQDLTAAVTWSSSNDHVAALSNAALSIGLATSVAPGTVTVGAVMNGITASTQLTVTPATLVLLAVTPANPSIALGTTLQFTATGTYTDGSSQDLTTAVTWSSSNTGAATLSNAAGSRGLATGVAQGTTTVGAIFNSVSASTQLTVTPATLVSLAISPTNPSIAPGTSLQFSATGTYTDGSTQDLSAAVTWDSSNAAVATVSNAAGSSGLATSVGAGTIIVGAQLNGVSASTQLTVTAATLVSLAITPAKPSIAAGKTIQFTATGTYSDGSTQVLTSTVTWESSDKTIATLSNDAHTIGTATGVAPGTVTVTATLNGISGSTQLSVTPAGLT